MGIFDKLFSKRKPKPSKSTMKIDKSYEGNWGLYFTNINDKIGSIMIDLKLHEIAPIKDLPNLVWITIKMNNPRENGLTSTEESEQIGGIEDKLVSHITSKFNSVHPGRTVSDNTIELLFYVGDATFYDKAITEVMADFPSYSFDYGIKEDTDWEEYLNFLYPLPDQLQEIENMNLVNELKQSGDKLLKAREVDHWIYFRNESGRANFQSKISNDGFINVNSEYDKSLGEMPYKLHIKRIDKVDLNSLNEYTLYLWNLANECDGEYDGWQTSIEKD